MRPCVGVANHTPTIRHTHGHHVFPLGMGGLDIPSNVADVCPNLHASTHQLLRITGWRYAGDTPWWIRRHFPLKARDLAYDGWYAWSVAPEDERAPVDNWKWQGATIAVDLLGLRRLMGYAA